MKFALGVARQVVVVFLAVAFADARARLGPGNESTDTGECERIYLRFSADHVLCKQQAGVCDLIATGVNNTERDSIVAIHNRYRSKIAIGNATGLPTAADMLEVEWDDELAAVAQAHANLCGIHSFCGPCAKIEKFPYVTAMSLWRPTNSEDTNRDWERYFQYMYEDVRNVSRESPESPVRLMPGAEEFARLAWAKTWRVGCGFSKYLSQRPGRRFEKRYTCAYGPGGDEWNEDVYKVGPPCSACPEGTCCGSSCRRYGFTASYEGLCKVTRDGPSSSIDQEDLLWTCQFNMDTQRGCRVQSEPADAFVTKTFFSTGFAEAVLQAGQSAEITFEQVIRPSKGALCAVVEFSKGPDVSGKPDRGLFNLVVTPLETPEQQKTINLPGSSVSLLRTRVNLTFDEPVQVGFLFVVPRRSSSQYLNIRSVTVYDKACSE